MQNKPNTYVFLNRNVGCYLCLFLATLYNIFSIEGKVSGSVIK